MTALGYAHYIIIVDRSGSMDDIKEDTQGGIRAFAKAQGKLPGRSTLTLCQFDTDYERVLSFSPLSHAERFKLVPRGGTALLDAIGRTVTAEGEHLAEMPEDERPSKVIVVIATDGQENSSREYKRAQVRELITQQISKYGWEFTYIGADQDSFAEAGAIGIPALATMDYARGSTRSAWASTTASASNYASGQAAGIFYTEEERQAAAGK